MAGVEGREGLATGAGRRSFAMGPLLTLRFRLIQLRDGIRQLTGWRRALVAIGAGALGVLAMAPFFFFPILIISFTLFTWLLDGAAARPLPQAIRRGALTAWFFSFGYLFPGLAWIGEAFLVDAETFAWLMPFAISLLPAGLALFAAVVIGAGMSLWRADRASRVVLLAVLWALAEWLRGHLFTGFPWNLMALTWIGHLEMAQTAAWIGSYGLSALTVAVAASFACLVDNGGPQRRPWRLPAVLCFAMVGLTAWGGLRLHGTEAATVPGVTLRLVQPNTPQQHRLDRSRHEGIWQRLVTLTEDAREKGVTHIVWPEAAPPDFLARRPEQLRDVAGFLDLGMVLLTGAARAENDGQGGFRFYNGFYALGPGGNILASYDKRHLVPFGEYIPFEAVLSRLGIQKIAQAVGALSLGDVPRYLEVPGAPPFAPLICYEIIFPGQAIEGTARPGWIVNVTDDAWFGDSIGPRQHFAIARMRAIEEGLPVVRAANGGISAVIDPVGRTPTLLPLHERGTVDGPLPQALGATGYALWGDVPFLLFTLLFLITFAFLAMRESN